MSAIHKTAIVEDGAILGENVQIGPYAFIGKNVKIGSGTTVGAYTIIDGKTTIGEDNRIFSHASIGTYPQDLKFDPTDDVELIIGNGNKIREFTLINPGTVGGGRVTKIGNNNLFMAYTHAAHDVIVGDECIFANGATLAGHVEIGDFVVVGGLTPVHQFVKIGSFAMIAGASALSQDVPPFCLAEGNRAVVKGLNLTGLRRRLDNREDIDIIRRAYKNIFESGRPIAQVAQEIVDENANSYVVELAQFVLDTKRGIPFNRKFKAERSE